MKRPTALLLGDGPTALSALRSLVRSFEVKRVLRYASDPKSDPVYNFAGEVGVPVTASADLAGLSALVVDLNPDVVVVSSFNLVIPSEVLTLTRFVNVHYSLLPAYRGRANVNWAILNGEQATGITIHAIHTDLDAGNILFQEAVPIGASDTATSLYERLNSIQERELGATVQRFLAGDVGIPQDADQATYGCSRIPTDGEISWNQDSVKIDRLIRALAPPFPGAFTYFEGKHILIRRAAPLPAPPRFVGRIPGRVVGRSLSGGWVDILTGDGVMRVFEIVDPAGGETAVPAATMIRSTRTTLGLVHADLVQRIYTLEKQLRHLIESPRQRNQGP